MMTVSVTPFPSSSSSPLPSSLTPPLPLSHPAAPRMLKWLDTYRERLTAIVEWINKYAEKRGAGADEAGGDRSSAQAVGHSSSSSSLPRLLVHLRSVLDDTATQLAKQTAMLHRHYAAVQQQQQQQHQQSSHQQQLMQHSPFHLMQQ